MRNLKRSIIWVLCLLYLAINFLFPSTPLASSTRTKNTETKAIKSTRTKVQKSNSRKTTKNKVPKSSRADLKVKHVHINPASPKQNKDATHITVFIQNFGGIRTSNKCSLNMSIWSVKPNNERENGKTNLNNIIPLYSYNIPELDPGETVGITKSLMSSFKFHGRHMVFGHINTEGLQPGEEKHQNNQYQKIFHVEPTLPDLVVCFKDYVISPVHRKSAYKIRIANIGDVTSPWCKLKWAISNKGTKMYTIPKIAPGDVIYVKREVYWASRGQYPFSLTIDYNKQVEEKDETNNTLAGQICTRSSCIGSTDTVCSHND